LTDRCLTFPEPLTARLFLQQYWQKTALNIPAAIRCDLPTLTADELGGLATLDDVESRLVFTERNGNRMSYRVEHGPFANAELENLPPRDWTLLIQDVEKHLPDFRAYLELTAFVPDWRVDDLMVSFAAPGGSVGPHLDHYDVFLRQGSGNRHWQLAEPGSVDVDPDSTEMKLLMSFADPSPILAQPGDVLYLPPGIPHWGVADNGCMTYSIGMRAPSRAELLARLPCTAARRVQPPIDDTDPVDDSYRDSNLTLAEAVPGLITPRAVERLRDTLRSGNVFSDVQLLIALGTIVTEPKPWLRPPIMDSVTARDVLTSLDPGVGLRVHGMARLAYFESEDACTVFANGSDQAFAANTGCFIKDLCYARAIQPKVLQSNSTDSEVRQLLLWLVRQGVFDL